MRPILLVPDAGPLFSLAAADLLPVLLKAELVVTDIVKQETFDRGRLPGASPEAIALGAFFAKHAQQIRIQETTIGTLLAVARRADPKAQLPNAGELSIQSFLISLRSVDPEVRALVLFEDAWFVRSVMVLPSNCTLISTSAFLANLERAGLIESAFAAERRIRELRPTFNAKVTTIERAKPTGKGRRRMGSDT
jgi:hypothetical protein